MNKSTPLPKALLFDMDGTLTDPRQPITEDMMEALRSVKPSIKKYLVTGSDIAKFLLIFFLVALIVSIVVMGQRFGIVV